MGLESSPSISAMAESIIIRNLSRRTASDSGEVIVLVGRTEVSTTLLLDSAACWMLLLKVMVFCACDGDFIVVFL
jgi:hypothetical protein